MEEHLMEPIGAEEVAKDLNISSFYFQKGFKIMTGYTVGEYIRNRRLYLAALDALTGKIKVIDLAYHYGYDTPESFTRAFGRFHGVSPAQIKNNVSNIKPFLPLRIVVEIKGGYDMDYIVEQMEAFQVIGLEKQVPYETSFQLCPQFWTEMCQTYFQKPDNQSETAKAIRHHNVGEFAVCLDGEKGSPSFRYIIGGRYRGGDVPEGMTITEIPSMQWARFKCVGPMPGALQTINERIFKEWLPGNPDYQMAAGINIEWYSLGDTTDADYLSEIWIPIKNK